MAFLPDDDKNAALDAFLAGPVYIGLVGPGGTELTGYGYARQIATFGPASGGVKMSGGAIDFPRATGGWDYAMHAALFRTATGGAAVIRGDLSPGRQIRSGDVLRIPPGGIAATAVERFGPWTLEDLDPFGNLDSLPASLDSDYWQSAPEPNELFATPPVIAGGVITATAAIQIGVTLGGEVEIRGEAWAQQTHEGGTWTPQARPSGIWTRQTTGSATWRGL